MHGNGAKLSTVPCARMVLSCQRCQAPEWCTFVNGAMRDNGANLPMVPCTRMVQIC